MVEQGLLPRVGARLVPLADGAVVLGGRAGAVLAAITGWVVDDDQPRLMVEVPRQDLSTGRDSGSSEPSFLRLSVTRK